MVAVKKQQEETAAVITYTLRLPLLNFSFPFTHPNNSPN